MRKPFWKDLTVGGMMAIVAACSLLFASIAYQVRMTRLSRDASRRMACANNLKQIGLALAEYADQHETYPYGSLPNPKLPAKRRLGWMYALIPSLDLPSVYAADQPDRPWDDPELHRMVTPPPAAVECPSNRAPGAPPAPAYIGIAGLGTDAPKLAKGDPRAGCFGDHRAVAPRDVTDGLSQTMMVAESVVPAGPWFAGGRATVRGLDPANQPYLGAGRQFGGIHPAGTNILMADGSIRTITESIAPKIFEAMSTISGGEKVSAPPP